MILFHPLHPKFTQEMAGLLPSFFSPSDPRPAAEQLNEAYAHGGGWQPQSKWKCTNILTKSMKYPGDRAITPIARAQLPITQETILLYPHSCVAIFQKDHSFEMGRVD